MWVAYFPHLMITPKKSKESSSCSRWCSACKDNLDFSVPLNLEPNQVFYTNLKKFFQENTIYFTEMSFLYYGDFFENFSQVKQGIENLYFHNILNDSHEVSVWVRAEKTINSSAIWYIKNWYKRWVFRLKFSLSLDVNFFELREKIIHFHKTLIFIEKIKLSKNSIILLQCNNIEFCSYSLREKIELFTLLKTLQNRYKFLEINFSDFIVNINLDWVFQENSFSYEKYKECIYINNSMLEYSLEKNFEDNNIIYIEHADIFTDSIAIHNPYCKKLKLNNFGSIKDSVMEINTQLRIFMRQQLLLSESYQKRERHISRCEFCINTLK